MNYNFWEDDTDIELPDEPHEVTVATKVFRPEVCLDQEELVRKRLADLDATEAERIACELGALACVEYKRLGSVEKTAMDYIDEVTDDQVRCVRLLNVVIPRARSILKDG